MLVAKKLIYIKPTKSGESFTFVDPINNNLYYIKTNVFDQRPKLNGCYEMSLDPKWIHEYESDGRHRRHFRIFIDAASEEVFNKGIKYIEKKIQKQAEWAREDIDFIGERKIRRAVFTLVFLVISAIIITFSFFTTKLLLVGVLPVLIALVWAEIKQENELEAKYASQNTSDDSDEEQTDIEEEQEDIHEE